jgi:hypothetical protein
VLGFVLRCTHFQPRQPFFHQLQYAKRFTSMSLPYVGILRLPNLLRLTVYLVDSPILRRLAERHFLSWDIGLILFSLAAIAVFEELVFGMLRLLLAYLRWIFWSIRWTLVCFLVYFGKRLLLCDPHSARGLGIVNGDECGRMQIMGCFILC